MEKTGSDNITDIVAPIWMGGWADVQSSEVLCVLPVGEKWLDLWTAYTQGREGVKSPVPPI